MNMIRVFERSQTLVQLRWSIEWMHYSSFLSTLLYTKTTFYKKWRHHSSAFASFLFSFFFHLIWLLDTRAWVPHLHKFVILLQYFTKKAIYALAVVGWWCEHFHMNMNLISHNNPFRLSNWITNIPPLRNEEGLRYTTSHGFNCKY